MYTSVDGVKAQFPQVREGQWGTGKYPDDDELEAAIAASDALIDDYCRLAYAVPFTGQDGYSTPETVSKLSLDLTVLALRGRIAGMSPEVDEAATAARKEIIRTLERIGAGQPPTLDWPAPVATSAPAGAPIATTPPDARLFTRDQLF